MLHADTFKTIPDTSRFQIPAVPIYFPKSQTQQTPLAGFCVHHIQNKAKGHRNIALNFLSIKWNSEYQW